MNQELKDFIVSIAEFAALTTSHIPEKAGEVEQLIIQTYSAKSAELAGTDATPSDIIDGGQKCITAGGKAFGSEKVQKMLAGINEAIDDGQQQKYGELVLDAFASIREIKAVVKEAKQKK